MEVGRCLHTVGVDSFYSRDKFGRDSFHPLEPHTHIVGPIPKNQIPQDRFFMVSVSISVICFLHVIIYPTTVTDSLTHSICLIWNGALIIVVSRASA